MSERDLLKEIRENRTFAENELSEQREESKKDRLAVAGHIWEACDPQALKDRKANKRPYLNSDEINQYINQVVNDVRANPRGIKYAPTGNGANDKGAEFYQNHTREIEYRSKASVVYAHAFEDAVTSGVGWLRLRTKREHVRTFNQDLWIDLIANADQVLPDPMGVWSDSRDIKFLYFVEPWARTAFAQKFPRAKAVSLGLEASIKLARDWVSRDIVQVGEYWKLESIERRLIAYKLTGADDSDAQTVLKDDLPDGKLPEGAENLREEAVEDTRVRSWLTNGLEILKEQEWPGKFIPFVSCYGKIVYIEGKRVVLSMTRLARDPAMLLAYMLTCEAEAVGGIPRSSWVGYEGQFAKPQRWVEANHKPVAFLEARVTVPGNPNPQQPLPLPQKQSWDPPIQNLEIAIEAKRRAVQAAMGISPQPTDVQRRNDISGEAWKQREAQGQKGSFHFVDAYDLMIERTGIILEDLMDKVLDTARDVPVRLPLDKAAIVRINDPAGSEYRGQGDARQLGGDPLFTKGDYRVTVSTGPADASQRAAADDAITALVANLQTIAQLAGPQVALKVLARSIQLKQLGPIGEEIVDLLDPQPMGQDGQPLPPQVAKLLGENQQLKQLVQQAEAEKKGKVVETQGKFAIAKMQEDAETQRAAADREVKLAIAELGARVDRLALFMEESRLVGVRAHERVQSGRELAHDSIERAKDRAHDHIQSAVAHEQALEQTDQAGQIAAAQQASAPALPEAGA